MKRGNIPTLTKENIQEILNKSYRNLIDFEWIKSNFNVSYSTAYRTAIKLNLKNSKQQFIDIVKKYLDGISVKELAKQYNVSTTNIRNILIYRGIELRHSQYFANFKYFETIEIEEKAYWLGFIMADGNVSKNSLIIVLSAIDIEHLKKFKKCINSNHNIIQIFHKNNRNAFKNANDAVRIVITDKHIVENLSIYYIVPNKTFITRFPDTIPKELYKHFIRGYLDGDGSFCCYQAKFKVQQKCGLREYINTKYCIDICGTIELLEKIKDIIEEELNINCVKNLQQRYKNRDNNNRTLKIAGKVNVLKVLDWLYKDSKIYLDRKYEKYCKILR